MDMTIIKYATRQSYIIFVKEQLIYVCSIHIFDVFTITL